MGRSRGGLTTKLHLACEQGQKLLSIVLTAGQRGDSPQFTAVLGGIRVPRLGVGRPRTRPDRVLADKAYTSATASTCGSAGSRPPSPARPTRTPTAVPKAPRAGGLPPSTPRCTSGATR
ncbi:transposase [Microbispora sp. H10885]|uniref:transposase n=1 Tax=Microbispora sp. H10885 TaxID=2729110 RepID=UPI0037CB17C3